MAHQRLSRSRSKIALAVFPFLLLCSQDRGLAQFKSGATLVELGAIVVDKSGTAVSGLTSGDFEILEDGRPVSITTFAAIDSDRPTSADDGRFLVVLVDGSSRSIDAAGMLLARMTEHDVAAVLSTGGSHARTVAGPEAAFAELRTIAQAGPAPSDSRPFPVLRGGEPINGVPDDGCGSCGTGGQSGFSGSFRGHDGLLSGPLTPTASGKSRADVSVLDAISDISRKLDGVKHRRKNLVYIGRASALDMTADAARVGDSGAWFGAIRDASRANVSVSIISTEGLTGRGYDGAKAIAEQTGGEALVNTNRFDTAADRVWQQSGHYYLLGYTPPRDGKKRHHVDVRVTRPELEVKALNSRG